MLATIGHVRIVRRARTNRERTEHVVTIDNPKSVCQQHRENCGCKPACQEVDPRHQCTSIGRWYVNHSQSSFQCELNLPRWGWGSPITASTKLMTPTNYQIGGIVDVTKISAGPNPPSDLHAIIEIPVGGVPVKYELDKESGAMFVDRFLHTAMFYPGNYGFIP